MPFLPIAERELRVASRRRGTHRIRFWAVTAASVLFIWLWWSMRRMDSDPAWQGHNLFIGLSILAFIFAVSSGLYTTSDSLSAEKREGTMGLLFLTDLKGYDIVVGKLVASSLNAAYGLVAIIPILGVPLLLGGVSMGEFIYAVFSVVSALFVSLAAGMVASTHNRHERKATFYTAFILFVILFVPVLAGACANDLFLFFQNRNDVWMFWCFSPGFLLTPLLGSNNSFPPESYWLGVVACWSWTVLFLLWVSLRLPFSWQEKVSSKKSIVDRRVAYLARRENARKKLRALLDINPFLWLSFRAEKKRNYIWAFLGAMGSIWLIGYFNYTSMMLDIDLLVPVGLMLNSFLKIWVITESCQQIIEARRSGALELLLSTPLTHHDIIRGQWLALRRQFGIPLIIVSVIELLLLSQSRKETIFVLTCIVFLPIDFFAAGWAGMWMGLNGKNTTRTILKVIVLLMALPWIVFYVSGVAFEYLNAKLLYIFPVSESWRAAYWAFVSVTVAYGVGFRWSRRRLLSRFRSVAAGQYDSHRGVE